MSDYINFQTDSKFQQVTAYLAGVEIPTISASVNFGTMRFPEITVDIPPHASIARLGADDRLPLAVMYMDNWAYDQPTECLLAEGEVTSWSYHKSANQRSMQLHAIDPLAALTSLFLNYINDIDTALGNSLTKKHADASGSDIYLNGLPLAFFYQYLQTAGDTIRRPVDILLNILGSISGFLSGIPIYSHTQQTKDAISKAKAAATLTSSVKGRDIYTEAKKFVGVGVASTQEAKEGPREFSSSGLIRFLSNKLNLNITAATPQALYDYCNSKGTVSVASVVSGLPGALLFESSTNNPSNIDSVSLVAPNGKVISVLTTAKVDVGDDLYRKIHRTVANFESRNVPNVMSLHRDKTGAIRGINIGLIQHNQAVGTLFEICETMRKKNKDKFDLYMGGTFGLEMFSSKGAFVNFVFHENQAYWFPKFQNLFADPEFIQIQYDFDKENYFIPALEISKQYGLDFERGLTMIMDIATHGGPRRAREITVKAVTEAGVGAPKSRILQLLAYHGDRIGKPIEQAQQRRNKILQDTTLSDTIQYNGAKTQSTVEAGIREIGQIQSWRKIVAYALIPGVTYETTQQAQGSGTQTTEPILDRKTQGQARLYELQRKKTLEVEKILKEIPDKKKAEVEFHKRFPDHAGQETLANKQIRDHASATHAIKRAKISIMFFMRWMQKSKILQKVIASPILEDPIEAQKVDGIFPVLKAMGRENVAKALVGYSQAISGRAGSIWDFLRSIYQVCLWELSFMIAPAAVKLDESNSITGRANSTTAKGSLGITSYVSKPNMYFSLPPSCNIWFSSMVERLQYQENYATQPTRTYLDDGTPAELFGLRGQDAFTYYATAKAAYPPVCDEPLVSPGTKIKNRKDVVVFPEELYKGPVTNRHMAPTWFYYLKKFSKKQNRVVSSASTPTSVTVKLNGQTAIYQKDGKTYSIAFADDTPSQITAKAFTQTGYYFGKPITFRAVGVEGKILHEKAAVDYLKFQAAAKKEGIDITLRSAFRTMAEQVSEDDGTSRNKPGFSLFQSGAALDLSPMLTRSDTAHNWVRDNAQKYGFSVYFLSSSQLGFTASLNTLVSIAAKNDLQKNAQQSASHSQQVASTTGTPIYIANPLPTALFLLMQGKNNTRYTRAKDPENQTYYNYAKFEHFREKYSSKVVQLSGVFNPYVVAGFPGYVFDDPSAGFHLAGTIVSGSHSISNAGQSNTSVNMTFARTFHEMFEQAAIDKEGLPIGPRDPITIVSDTTQQIDNARKYYKALLYGNEDFFRKDPLGDYQNILGWANLGAPPDKIVADVNAKDFNLIRELNRQLDVLPTATGLFADTNAALKYCARPVCTMEQYIDFYNGVRRLAAKPGGSIGGGVEFDGRFYMMIRDFSFGDGAIEDPTEDGISLQEMYRRLAALPPTIRDWQKTLLAYRHAIYNE